MASQFEKIFGPEMVADVCKVPYPPEPMGPSSEQRHLTELVKGAKLMGCGG